MKARHSSICTVALLVAAIALSGCSSKKLQPAFEPVYDDPYSFEAYLENRKKADRSSMSQEERFAYDNRTASLSTMRESGIPLPNLHLIEQAKTALGTPYVPGGTDTQGFDCSGFVQWAYRNVGVTLPRTAREQSVMGRPIKSGSMMAGRHRRLQPSPARLPYGHLSRRRLVHPQPRTRQKRIHRRPVRSLFQLHLHRCPQSPVQGIRRRSHQKTHGAGLPQTHPHPQGRPCFESKALRYAKTNVRSGSRTPDTGRYPPQGRQPRPQNRNPRRTKKTAGQPLPPGNRRRLHKRQPKPQRKPSPRKRKPPGNRQPKPQIPKRVPYPQKTPRFRNRPKAKAAPAKAGKEGKAAQPVAGKKAVPAKADGKTTATAKAPVKTKAEQPKATTQAAKTTATAPAKAAQTQKPAQNSKASAKAPTNSAPVKARATQAKSEKAAPKQPAKTAQQKSGK